MFHYYKEPHVHLERVELERKLRVAMKVFLVVHILPLLFGGYWCSSSYGTGVAPQRCGTSNTQYCCPAVGQSCSRCVERSLRCTNSEPCDYQNIGGGDQCFAANGSYNVKLGRSKLFGRFSKRKRFMAVEHQFIQYRGFTYEFGSSYGVQILDVNDPGYKYANNTAVVKGISSDGTSKCSWEEATLFTRMWKKSDYGLFTKNCQHFAKALKVFLTESSCSDGFSRNKRQTQVDLEVEIDQILRDCNITCCNDSPGSHGVINSMCVLSLLLSFLIVGVVY